MRIKLGSVFTEPYHIINLCFAGIIILVFIYSGIFSADKNNHPIKSACATVEGHPCKSEGLSRSFSEIVRLDFESARTYNKHGLKIFMFFFIQLLLRTITSTLLIKEALKQKKLVLLDSIVSTTLYFYCFWGIIV